MENCGLFVILSSAKDLITPAPIELLHIVLRAAQDDKQLK
jgi:hypothetical protein